MFPNFNLNFKRNITSNESGGNKSPEKEILTEDDVRNRLKELEDYKKGIVKFKDLSPETKKFLNSFGINNLDKEIKKLQKECEVFDEANRRYTSLEPLFKEKEELKNKIKSLESEYSRLDEEYERRDKAGGGAHAEEIGMEMSLIDNQIKELKEKLELINKEL